MSPEERELNNWLGEHVMGWRRYHWSGPTDTDTQSWEWRDSGYVHQAPATWSPTTDPASCDLLLDKISADGWSWALTCSECKTDLEMWRTRNGAYQSAQEAAETKFLAIALCAKKAYS